MVDPMPEAITVKDRPGAVGADGTRVEVEVRVPYTAYGRKIYHTPATSSYRIPQAHVHTSPHLLMCLTGEAVIAYRPAPGSPVVRQPLRAGESWRVAGGVAHQLLLRPETVVASYFSPLSWLGHGEELEVLDEDWLAG